MRSPHRVDYTQPDNPATKRALEELKRNDPDRYEAYMNAKFQAEMQAALGEQGQKLPPRTVQMPEQEKKKRKHRGKTQSSFSLPPPTTS